MGVSIDTGGGGGRKSVDVEINLVPFIDMMSCLVAFLLITAVWTNLAAINIKPGGIASDAPTPPPDQPPITLSVLVSSDGIWLGLSNGMPEKIDKNGDDNNWQHLSERLHSIKTESGLFNDRDDIEVAAEDKIDYQTVITAMDTAITEGFGSVKFTDPSALTVKFKQ
jgi:biopolymer transport protein ExbD